MSNQYKNSNDVPTLVLAERLSELSTQITKGNISQFVMRIPAELDFCPDLVLSNSARRLKLIDTLKKDAYDCCDPEMILELEDRISKLGI